MKRAYLKHLRRSAELATTEAGFRAGLAALSVEYQRRARPFLAEARALKFALSVEGASESSYGGADLDGAFVAASGLQAAGVRDASAMISPLLLGMAREYRRHVSPRQREELIGRFMLSRGATLAVSMRNVGGFMAQCKLTRSIIAHLTNAGAGYQWLHGGANEWAAMSEEDADIELHLRGLAWQVAGKARTLVYNLTVPLFRNNVDMCLFHCAPDALTKATHQTAAAYLALGELKGGIDPAGADEHWKTARTALGRIHSAFGKLKLKPKTFFIGAAIEAKMASEIWAMLEAGELDNAANLTEDDQIASITGWLCSL